MLETMKTFRNIFMLTILAIGCIAVLFFLGWVQYAIPVGKYGVLLSKSGGYHRQALVPGTLTWRWERLLPANARILVFDLAPRRIQYTIEGSLPLADQYSKILNTKDTFSWSFSAEALVNLKPEQLVDTVSKNKLQTQEELDTYSDSHIQALLQTIMHRYISELMDDPYEYQRIKTDYHAFSEKIKKELEKAVETDFSVAAVTLSKITVPDLHTYKIAEQAYTIYEQQREMLLAETAAKEAAYAASEQFQIERLTRWGEFLEKYPRILELIAVAQKDSKATLEALQTLNKKEP